MHQGLLALQLSHVFYFIAGILAWQKGYKPFAVALFAMIVVSMVNHRAEQLHNIDSSALEWFEKTVVLAVGTFGAIQFRDNVDLTTWAILGFSIIFFVIGNNSYFSGRSQEYLTAHTLWHVGTGISILRIVRSAPMIH